MSHRPVLNAYHLTSPYIYQPADHFLKKQVDSHHLPSASLPPTTYSPTTYGLNTSFSPVLHSPNLHHHVHPNDTARGSHFYPYVEEKALTSPALHAFKEGTYHNANTPFAHAANVHGPFLHTPLQHTPLSLLEDGDLSKLPLSPDHDLIAAAGSPVM
eukprot:TRINITY_DN5907_c0_g1_i1.p1 TRINITY_DN5907_c0_g1~~TRINITY_DN5907_c0_g1_i1.p1  ORF type:complete len:157 (+),score=28.37 TRINITY_DN5907_c0_g1_i1:110-580(+)